jgi:hypothetical protein
MLKAIVAISTVPVTCLVESIPQNYFFVNRFGVIAEKKLRLLQNIRIYLGAHEISEAFRLTCNDREMELHGTILDVTNRFSMRCWL